MRGGSRKVYYSILSNMHTYFYVYARTKAQFLCIYTPTSKFKYLIAQAPGVIPHPLPEVIFLMVEIPSPKPYIFMIRVNRQMKCPKS